LEDPIYFRYTPPNLGRAVGVLPYGYIRPELRIQDLGIKDAEQDVDVVYDTDSEIGDSDDEGTSNSEATSTTQKESDSSFESSGSGIEGSESGSESSSPQVINLLTPSWHSDEE
jgi:hypothetical protein